MVVMITGVAGFIGSNILDKLILCDSIDKIIGVDNLINGTLLNIHKHLNNKKFELFELDIINTKILKNIILKNNISVICHQAAVGSVPLSIQFPTISTLNNGLGFASIIESSKDTAVKKIIYASSSSVYGSDNSTQKKEEKKGVTLSPYALSKKFNEEMAFMSSELYGISFYGLRYFNVFGKKQKKKSLYSAMFPIFINSMLSNDDIYVYGDGQQSRDFTPVENVVDININIILNDFINGADIFNIGLNQSRKVIDIFNVLKEMIGYKKSPIFLEKRAGDIEHSKADISKAKKILGYDPQTTFDEGLYDTILYYKKN